MRTSFIVIMALACLAFAATAQAVLINEWVSNDISSDDYEFIELYGAPGESLDGLTIVIIEGEGGGSGTIDRILALDGYAIGASGYFVIGDATVAPDLEKTWTIENGGNNILLLQGFDEGLYPTGTDIDAEDDCVADFDIGTVVDGVGYGYGYSAADCASYYGIPTVGPDGSYDPAGGARCDDSDPFGEWFMICMNGTEPAPTGIECAEADGYYIGWATPGTANDCSPVSNESASWGELKANFR